jgi:hypothetical protein
LPTALSLSTTTAIRNLHQQEINYHLFNYDLYGPVRNVFDAGREITLRGQVGGGWALEMESFLGPVKWHRAPSTPFILPLQLGPLASPPPTPHLPPPLPIQNLLEINSKL